MTNRDRSVAPAPATEVGPIAAVRGRVEQLRHTASPDPAEHHVLRARLDAVPARRRGLRWREASVFTDLLFRRRPRKVFRQLGRMRRQHDVNGTMAEFEEFWTACQRVLASDTLGPHGYRPALAGTDDRQLWREVVAVQSRLAALGRDSFANSGTLLGLIRDGSVIAHDDDVDLAVVLTAGDGPGAASEWIDLRGRLSASGALDEEFEQRGKIHCRIRTSTGVGIDLFPAWVSAGRVFVWPHTSGELAVDDVFPLAGWPVPGGQVWVPRHPDPMLEQNYGPHWRSPDPTFRFDWVTAKSRFPGFLSPLEAPPPAEMP